MQKVVAMLGLLLLAGCETPEKMAAQAAEAQRVRDDNEIAQCIQLEFKPGSPEFSNCRLKIRVMEEQKEDNARARRAALVNAILERRAAAERESNREFERLNPRQTICHTSGNTTTCR